MQNRSAVWIFTILLALACLWQLSFSYFTGRVESKARVEAGIQVDSMLAIAGNERLDRDSLYLGFENKYLRSHAEEPIYPLLKYTYRECKEKEINLGLDLKGGMAVTLEVSIPELVANLSGNSDNAQFTSAMAAARERMRSSDKDFISLFAEEWDRIDPNARLAAVFHSQEREQAFPREASNPEIVDALKREAQTAINNTENIMRERIDKFGVAQPSIQKQQFSGRIQIELPGVKDKTRVRKVLQSTANLEFWETFDNSEVYPLLEKANTALSAVLHPEMAKADTTAKDTAATAEAAADTTVKAQEPEADEASADTVPADSTLTEDLAADSDTTDLAADTTGVDTTEAAAEFAKKNPLFAVMRPSVFQGQGGGYQLAKGAAVGNARIADTAEVNRMMRMPVFRNALPADMRLLWSAKPMEGTDVLTLYAMKVPRGSGGKPKLDGSVIIDAAQDFDLKGDVEVRMQMNAEGAQIWKVMTADNVGKAVAIVLDDMVYSAPTVISEIPSGNSSITLGGGDLNKQIQEAEDLANILKAGALPAPARIIDETVVGPTLGAENVQSGLLSFGIALVAVLLVMWAYYARAGWVADLALLCNVFFLIGVMASLQATLTLPGIAGIVLTVGMAVDANVLINERVREELRAGRNLKSAVHQAFSNQGALSAIIDSNVTAFATAVILYVFGSGPIRGFATASGIGILTSLFTAVFISRLIMERRLDKGRPITFWRNWSKNILVGTRYNFMGRRRVFYAVSGVIIAICCWSIFTRGFNWGVDFSGGRSYLVKFDEEVNVEQVEQKLEQAMATDGREYTASAKTYGGSRQVQITTNYLIDQPGMAADSLAELTVNRGLTDLGAHRILATRKVDPTISDDIKIKAWTSVLIALAFIFLYIAVRFRNWQYGLGALLSLVHDTVLVVGLYSLLWGRVGFSLEIDEAFIAVILTVIGKSINDTVVVFDRIREYLRDHKRETVVSVFNMGINATLTRTLNTGFNMFLVLAIIFFFGGIGIKGFVFGLFVGMLIGTYSAVFIASAITVDLLKNRKSERAKEAAAMVATA